MSRNHLYRRVSILALAGFVAGCTVIDPGAKSQGARDILKHKNAFVEVSLPSLLDPEATGQETASQNAGEAIESAFHGFYGDETEDNVVLRRNRVQDRLIAASNESCKDFKEKLRQIQSEGNFILGGITTALAGAGAIVTGALGARALAGSAGVTSGLRAEFNDAYFASKTVEVLTKAFEVRRKDLLAKIDEHRKNSGSDIIQYPVERAVADALNYHAACNLISGLEEAGDRVTKSEPENVGLGALQRSFNDAGLELSVDIQKLIPAEE